MARRRINITRCDIVKVATRRFLTDGYTATTAKMISDEVGISTGNLTFYFPTKEHLLALVIRMLCDFQWRRMRELTEDGTSALLAFCLELASVTAGCDGDPVVRDLFLSAYKSPMTLEIIRRNDCERAAGIFGEFCRGWGETNYKEAELLVSGIEYTTFMETEFSPGLDVRISGAIGSIMMIYGVPEEIWRRKVDKVLGMDYRRIGRELLLEFIEYTGALTEEEIDSYVTSETTKGDKV
ncbi:MAG: TetR/AcrR family transcriptional regulator [Clostridia bacterium]|nr:TetR/AcrR family transcriptional regulator [Clostridia bacterium]